MRSVWAARWARITAGRRGGHAGHGVVLGDPVAVEAAAARRAARCRRGAQRPGRGAALAHGHQVEHGQGHGGRARPLCRGSRRLGSRRLGSRPRVSASPVLRLSTGACQQEDGSAYSRSRRRACPRGAGTYSAAPRCPGARRRPAGARGWRRGCRGSGSPDRGARQPEPFPDRHLVRGEDRLAQPAPPARARYAAVCRALSGSSTTSASGWSPGRGQFLHPLRVRRGRPRTRDDPAAPGGDHLHAPGRQEAGEERGDVLGVGRGDRDPGGAQLAAGRGRRRRTCWRRGARRSWRAPRPARARRPSRRRSCRRSRPRPATSAPRQPQLLDAGGQALGRARLAEGLGPAGVLVDIGVEQRQSDVAVEHDLDPREVVLRGVARIEKSYGRHVHPSVASGCLAAPLPLPQGCPADPPGPPDPPGTTGQPFGQVFPFTAAYRRPQGL